MSDDKFASSEVDSRASILFVNVHKGASTFIADEFADLAHDQFPQLSVVRFGSEILTGQTEADLPIPPRDNLFVRVYPGDVKNLVEVDPTDPPLSGLRMVLMYRDPRDAAVSMYYSMAYSHTSSVRNPEAFLKRREELQGMSVADGVAHLAKPVINEFLLINRIAESYPDAWLCSYEDLVGDYRNWIRRLAKFVEWPTEDMREIYRRSKRSFNPPEVEDASKHVRRISPGNWTEVFDDRLRDLFETECGEQMRQAGYTW